MVPSREYVRWMRETPGLGEAVGRSGRGGVAGGHRLGGGVRAWRACTCTAGSTRTVPRPAACIGPRPPVGMALPRPRDYAADDARTAYGGDEVRYARWDGSQRLPDLTAEDILGVRWRTT